MFNSLSQTLLKVASPGIPDFYQGTEIWDFSLVDPDNRRPVDFDLRKKMLKTLKEKRAGYRADLPGFARALLQEWRDGSIKLYVTLKISQLPERKSPAVHGRYLSTLDWGWRSQGTPLRFCKAGRRESRFGHRTQIRDASRKKHR